MNRLIGITGLRNSAKELVDSLKDGPVIILRRNRPVAVLVAFEEYEEWARKTGRL